MNGKSWRQLVVRPTSWQAACRPPSIELPHAVTSRVWHKVSMARLWLAAFLVVLAGSAFAAPVPRLERERCTFKPPRGDRVECFVLVVLENREQPESREVRLKVAVLKAKRTAGAEPMFYLSGGPGDAPLVASSPGADALAEGDCGTRPPPSAVTVTS